MNIRTALLAATIPVAASTCMGAGMASATHAGNAVGCPFPTDHGTVTLGGLTPDYSNGATVVDDSGNTLGVLPGDGADHAFGFTGVGVGGVLVIHVTSLASPQHRAGDYIHDFTFTVTLDKTCSPPPPTTATTSPPSTSVPSGSTTTTSPGAGTTTTAPPAASTSSPPGSPSTTPASPPDVTLPPTGLGDTVPVVILGGVAVLALGAGAVLVTRRRRP